MRRLKIWTLSFATLALAGCGITKTNNFDLKNTQTTYLNLDSRIRFN